MLDRLQLAHAMCSTPELVVSGGLVYKCESMVVHKCVSIEVWLCISVQVWLCPSTVVSKY